MSGRAGGHALVHISGEGGLMSRREELEDMLATLAGRMFGAGRAQEMAPSLTERAGHVDQVARAGLDHDEEPATAFFPRTLAARGDES